jgi:hypothetical protein
MARLKKVEPLGARTAIIAPALEAPNLPRFQVKAGPVFEFVTEPYSKTYMVNGTDRSKSQPNAMYRRITELRINAYVRTILAPPRADIWISY